MDFAPSAVRWAVSGACPVSPLGGPLFGPEAPHAREEAKDLRRSGPEGRRCFAALACGGGPDARSDGRGSAPQASISSSSARAAVSAAPATSDRGGPRDLLGRCDLVGGSCHPGMRGGDGVAARQRAGGEPPRAAGGVRRAVGRGRAAQQRPGRACRSGLVPGRGRGDVPMAGRRRWCRTRRAVGRWLRPRRPGAAARAYEELIEAEYLAAEQLDVRAARPRGASAGLVRGHPGDAAVGVAARGSASAGGMPVAAVAAALIAHRLGGSRSRARLVDGGVFGGLVVVVPARQFRGPVVDLGAACSAASRACDLGERPSARDGSDLPPRRRTARARRPPGA